MSLPLLVLDASAALALVLTEVEGAAVALALEDTTSRNGQVFVPALFWYELGNGLLSAERRRRLNRQQSSAAARHFRRLPIVTDVPADDAELQSTLDLARKHALSFYDAGYLELALRYQARLLSCDEHLVRLQGAYPQVFAP